MVEELFDLLDSLVEKQDTIESIVKLLGGEDHKTFLYDDIQKVELLIVKAFGGNEGHYNHIHSTDHFYNYAHYADRKDHLVDYIKATIENDWTDEVGIIISYA